MAILPLNLARVSNQLRTSVVRNAITRAQGNLLAVQNELTTGKRLNAPSDDPGDSAVVQQLRKTLERRLAYADNLKFAGDQLSQVDTTLADVTDLLQQAQNVASANVGSDVTPDARAAAAEIIKGLYQQMLTLGNKQFNGTYLFAGDRGDRPPFIETAGGIQFIGSENTLANTYDENTILSMGVNGADVFGAVSSRVRGTADLTPAVTAGTRLADLRGATGTGVVAGAIRISNGSTSTVIDLSRSETLGDIIATINAGAPAGVSAAIAPDGVSLLISGGAGDNLAITEVGGTAAADLGILQPAGAGAGNPIDGSALAARITPFTLLADLAPGSSADLSSGLMITAGAQTRTISFSGLNTVQEMLNAINGAGVGLQARINSNGNGIDIINTTSGVPMTIGEAAGGTTASDMGLRSLHAGTALSELNNGKGVRMADGADFRVTRMDGTSFDVDLNGANTVQDVIAAINAADAGGGVTASLALSGNGIRLIDSTGGTGTLNVGAINASLAARDLGLLQVPSANQINGADVNPVNTPGIFGNLAKLRDALLGNDQAAITEAAEALQADYGRVVRLRGATGARVQDMESRGLRLDDQNLATTAFLSTLEDTDFTDAITRFQTLQTALQAAMQTTARTLDLSLLDFLA